MTISREQPTNRQRRATFRLPRLVVATAACAVLAACGAAADGPDTDDIVSAVPWGAAVTLPEAHTYRLEEDGEQIGTTVLTVERQEDGLLLVQRSSDDEGNSDTAEVLVDAETLKPFTSTRTIIDEDQRRVAVSNYEAAPEGDCDDTGEVVRIQQRTFDPPDEEDPDERSAPLCVPEHAYENDASLFIWRTIRFEDSYSVTYNTVIATRRSTQAVTLTVRDRVTEHPAGDREAWLVEISGDGLNQRAWFSTDDAHVLLAYQNESFLFVLEE